MAPQFPAHAAFTLLNLSRDVFCIADGGGTLRYVSPSAANLFGFKNGAFASGLEPPELAERCGLVASPVSFWQ